MAHQLDDNEDNILKALSMTQVAWGKQYNMPNYFALQIVKTHVIYFELQPCQQNVRKQLSSNFLSLIRLDQLQ